MEKIEVIIDRAKNVVGLAQGKTREGQIVLVRNGDLLCNENAFVCVVEKTEKYVMTEIEETYQSMDAVADLLDKYSLIPLRSVSIRDGHFFAKGKYLFPDRRIRRVLDYISDKQELWDVAKIALTTTRGVSAGAMRFGMTLKKALEKMKKTGLEKARLYCPNPQDFSGRGQVAEMLATLYGDDEGNWVLQIWQGIGDSREVTYCHAKIARKSDLCTHFDTAVIDFDISERDLLFGESAKRKGNRKKKLFQIDGSFSIDIIHEIANRSFPLDELIDEYFEIESIR